MAQMIGEIIQVIGPVIDVSFEETGDKLPSIYEALEITRENGQKLIVGGDIILSINGVKFENSDESLLEISEVMQIKQENTPLEIVVFRAGKKVTLGRK